jgi:hypothetical protein
VAYSTCIVDAILQLQVSKPEYIRSNRCMGDTYALPWWYRTDRPTLVRVQEIVADARWLTIPFDGGGATGPSTETVTASVLYAVECVAYQRRSVSHVVSQGAIACWENMVTTAIVIHYT